MNVLSLSCEASFLFEFGTALFASVDDQLPVLVSFDLELVSNFWFETEVEHCDLPVGTVPYPFSSVAIDSKKVGVFVEDGGADVLICLENIEADADCPGVKVCHSGRDTVGLFDKFRLLLHRKLCPGFFERGERGSDEISAGRFHFLSSV